MPRLELAPRPSWHLDRGLPLTVLAQRQNREQQGKRLNCDGHFHRNHLLSPGCGPGERSAPGRRVHSHYRHFGVAA